MFKISEEIPENFFRKELKSASPPPCPSPSSKNPALILFWPIDKALVSDHNELWQGCGPNNGHISARIELNIDSSN